MNIELKPCPFCGQTPCIRYGYSLGDTYAEGMETHYIWCDCGAYMEVESKGDLVKAWNKRIS